MGGTDLHDGVDDAFTELEAGIVFQAICEEAEEDVCFIGETMV